MKAIQFLCDSSATDSAEINEIPTPSPSGHDILVKIEAIGLNPVDTKVRPDEGQAPKTLGYDAAGTVVSTGDKTSIFKEAMKSTTLETSRAPAPMPSSSSSMSASSPSAQRVSMPPPARPFPSLLSPLGKPSLIASASIPTLQQRIAANPFSSSVERVESAR